jgi:hypothetical protein
MSANNQLAAVRYTAGKMSIVDKIDLGMDSSLKKKQYLYDPRRVELKLPLFRIEKPST